MNLKKYKLRFDLSGLALFLIVMLPNFIWFVAALCVVMNKERKELRLSPLLISSIAFIALYFLGWIFYYAGVSSPVVIMLLTLPPCLAFISFALDRKNLIAVVPAVCFMMCHLVYGTVNFIV